jgi:lipid II:glycine glycyltransferase (peptidoglycan interpeptide bridge formation enzyme)
MEVREITDQKPWEDYVKNHPKGTFLQSLKFGEMNGVLGDKPIALGMYRGDNVLKGVALVIRVKAKRGDFLYIPYGPLLDDNDLFLEFISYLKELAKKEKVNFIRVSPFIQNTPDNQKLYVSAGFRPSPLHMLAEHLWFLDLEGKEEDEVFVAMEKKHKNLIRRAKKDGVKIRISTLMPDVDDFLELHDETVKRHHFTPYPRDYFKSQVKLFAKDDEVLVFSAEYEGKTLASAIVMYYGTMAAYHHGASTSDPAYRKIPASYLMQWTAIQEAMKRKCRLYNFWGIAPDENSKHPFYGITHFKKGFGGRRYDLLHCQDLPINKKYLLNWGVETARKWRRGF